MVMLRATVRLLAEATAAAESADAEKSISHATEWVSLQALTAFFVIVGIVACALLMRPIAAQQFAARQYQPI